MDILRNVPLGFYLETPQTWMHRLDPRVKLVWLLSVLLSPILATSEWRLLQVGGLILLPVIVGLPRRVWLQQLPWILALGFSGFIFAAIAPDALGVTPQIQRQGAEVVDYGMVAMDPVEIQQTIGEDPPTESTASAQELSAEDPLIESPLSPEGSPPDPSLVSLEPLQPRMLQDLPPATHYRYTVFSAPQIRFQGRPLRITRRTLSVGIRIGTLFFTLLYATNLFLITTAPEEVSEAIERLAHPLKRFKLPIAEIILTLTLSLRFLPLVVEEVQNLIRSVRTRDIRWRSLSIRGGIHLILALVERFLENLMLRAEQTATAMQVRGYLGPDHPVRWSILKILWLDRLMLGLLILFWGIRIGLFSS